MTTPLITVADVKEFKGISSNINAEKDFLPLVTEAQIFDVAPILGDSFFLDIITGLGNSPVDEKWTELFEGKTYVYNTKTYQFFGLKAVIIYHAFARFLSNDGVQSTPSGFVTKQSQYSDPIDAKRLSMKIQQARSGAQAHEQRMVDFLRRNKETYPEFNHCETDNAIRKAGVKFRKIG